MFYFRLMNAWKISAATRGSTGLRLSEFVQISEFFRLYITDFCQMSESFAKSINFKYEMPKKDCSSSENSLWIGLFMECIVLLLLQDYVWKGLCAFSSSPCFNGTTTVFTLVKYTFFCCEYVLFGPITQILLRQMRFDSDLTQISAQKNGEWSLCSFP